MYIGRYYHRLEAKNRVSLPVKFREQVQAGAVITRGLDGCLSIFDQERWGQRMHVLAELKDTKKAHRAYLRYMTNDAQELEIDGQGRIRISDDLKMSAFLEKEIVFVGSYDHIEIWSKGKYHEYIDNLEKNIESDIEGIDIHGTSTYSSIAQGSD